MHKSKNGVRRICENVATDVRKLHIKSEKIHCRAGI